MIGYKAVARKQERGWGWFLCELEIPDDAKIVKDMIFMRTDKATPRAFYPVNMKMPITEREARSWFDPNFTYKIDKLATSELTESPYTSFDIKGIYFFESAETACNWGCANLGKEGAL